MTSTLSSALEARGIPGGPGDLTAEVEADIGGVDRDESVVTLLSKAGQKMRVVTDVRFHYRVNVPPGKREAAEEALRTHDLGCAVNQTLRRGINITCSWDIRET